MTIRDKNRIINIIKQDLQIKKFCMYGFFKNLKFFEPYLLVYLSVAGLNLFQIGILISVRAAITIIFEVPSALIADFYGKKKELLICFLFYMMSFILLFVGKEYYIFLLGMVFFGLGEAFRSGTHKAMILSYLESKDWYKYKAYVYGRTRSYSLVGSSLSAILSIVILYLIPMMKWIFIASIIPYIFDFILIMTYPDCLNEKKGDIQTRKEFWFFGLKQVSNIMKHNDQLSLLMSSATFDSVFKSMKDYIQPILGLFILSTGIGVFGHLNKTQSLNLYLGSLYALFYIFSSIGTRNVFRLTNKFGSIKVFEKSFDLMGVFLIVLGILVKEKLIFLTMMVYLALYVLMNLRRPTFVDVISDYMIKEERVTVLSVESQLKALLTIFIAPIFGFIADKLSISVLFVFIGLVFLSLNRFLLRKV